MSLSGKGLAAGSGLNDSGDAWDNRNASEFSRIPLQRSFKALPKGAAPIG